MAPTQSRQVTNMPVSRNDSGEGQVQQSPEVQMHVSEAERVVLGFRTERTNNRAKIEKEHKERSRVTKSKIDTLFDTRKTKVMEAQRTMWLKLASVNKRREELESQILASMKVIETQTGNISREILAILTGRMEDIETPSSPED